MVVCVVVVWAVCKELRVFVVEGRVWARARGRAVLEWGWVWWGVVLELLGWERMVDREEGFSGGGLWCWDGLLGLRRPLAVAARTDSVCVRWVDSASDVPGMCCWNAVSSSAMRSSVSAGSVWLV